MVGGQSNTEVRQLVANRIEYIELLNDDALATHEIVNAVNDSRSTVTRALRNLRDAGLVSKDSGLYSATATGTVLAATHREYQSTVDGVVSAEQLLEPLDGSVELPPELFPESSVTLAENRGPFAPIEAIADTVAQADGTVAYLPALSSPLLLRVWREQVITEGGEIDLTLPPNVFNTVKGQYPDLLADMHAEGVTLRSATGPDYGVLRTEEEEPTLSVLTCTDTGAPHGVLQTIDTDAIDWAERQLTEIHATATAVTNELAELTPQRDGGSATASKRVAEDTATASADEPDDSAVLPDRLNREGFVRLSDAYLEANPPAPPEVAWRTGLSLSDVYAGRAVERFQETEQGQESLIQTIRTRLRDGDGCVIVGPPGSGKSTVCKQVAWEWHEEGHGPVLYRERGNGTAFDSPALLEAYLRRADGRPLVVVEDVVRAAANPIFDTVQTLSDAGEAAFLFDTRREEWREASDSDQQIQPAVLYGGSLDTVQIPTLSEATCERLVNQFETETDISTDISPDRLLADIRRQDADATSRGSGEPVLVQHRLAQHIDPVQDDGTDSQTILAAETQRLCRSLVDDSSAARLNVAVLSALLTTTGLSVTPAVLHSLAAEHSNEEVANAIDTLEGRLLFPSLGTSTPEYRTRHELWAEQFLQQLSTVEEETVARRVIVRVVNALFSLPDDNAFRKDIRDTLDEPTPLLNQIAHHPQQWADEVVKRVFQFGIRTSEFGLLLGRTETSNIELPETCSTVVELQARFCRGRLFDEQGRTEAARNEYVRLREQTKDTEELSNARALRLRVKSLNAEARMESTQGNVEHAERHILEALELAEELDDSDLLSQIHVWLGVNLGRRSEPAAARNHFEQALDHARSAGNDRRIAQALDCLATVAFENEGDFERARRQIEEAYELQTAGSGEPSELTIHDGPDIVATAALIAWEQSRLDEAVSYAQRTNERARECGQPRYEARGRWILGHVATSRGNLERANQHLTRAVEIAQEYATTTEGSYQRAVARFERYRGDLNAAMRAAERAKAIHDDCGFDNGVIRALREQALIALRRGSVEAAQQYLEEGNAVRETMEIEREGAVFALLAARVTHRLGETVNLDNIDDSIETFQARGQTRLEAEGHRLRAHIVADRNRLEEAATHVKRAVETAEMSSDQNTIGRVAETAGAIAADCDATNTARTHYEQAFEAFMRLNDEDRAAVVAEKLVAVCERAGDAEAAGDWQARAESVSN